MKTVQFNRWPVWNFHFPEKDVKRIIAVRYSDAGGTHELDRALYRLAIGRNGVSALVLLQPGLLPQAASVEVEYEP